MADEENPGAGSCASHKSGGAGRRSRSAPPAPPPPTTPAIPNTAPAVTKSPTAVSVPVQGTISKADRERALGMLDAVMKGIEENYYDPKLKGLDWDSIHEKAKAKIEESNSLNGALAQIAAAVGTLNDGHTRFVPPYKPYKLDFGLKYQMVWSRCFVTRVRPGSDAAAKNVRPAAKMFSTSITWSERWIPGRT